MNTETRRIEVLRSYGASAEDIEQLLEYNRNRFIQPQDTINHPSEFPFPDEKFVAVWQNYALEAGDGDLFEVLKGKLIQLRFPIEQGISQQERYREATLMGK